MSNTPVIYETPPREGGTGGHKPPGGVQGQRPGRVVQEGRRPSWPPEAPSLHSRSRSRARSRPSSATTATAAGYLLLLALLLLWEIAARGGVVRPDLLPPVSGVLAELGRLAVSGTLWRQGGATLGRVLAGFVVGGGSGVILGFCCGVFPEFGRASRTTVEFLRPMPSVALIPIGILFLGLGFGLCVGVTGFACCWPAYVAALAGAAAAGPELLATARVYGLSRRETILLVRAPAALPQVLAGLRVALAVAVAVTVTTEMAAASSGLGSFILEASLARRPEAMYAGIVAVGLLGCILNAGFVVLRDRLLRWMPQPQRGR